MNTYDLAFQQQRQSLYTAQVADTQYHEYDLFPRLKGKKTFMNTIWFSHLKGQRTSPAQCVDGRRLE